jgi:phage/plasmid-like protein (TIGR03299 family)
MSHELELTREGKALMAYAGELPWHGLGTKVSNDLTPEQFMKAAGLDWTVHKVPQKYVWEGQEYTSKHAVLIRSDGVELSPVSEDWETCQNHEAFAFFNEYVQEGGMEMHTAGSLFGGKKIWILAKLKKMDMFLWKKDRIDPYFLFTNPHEYGTCIDLRLTPVRAVCNNTVTLALGTKSQMSIKLNHRTPFDPVFAKQALGMATKSLEEYKELATFLGNRRAKADEVVEYLKKVFPASSAVRERDPKKLSRPARIAFLALKNQPGADIRPDSWWQSYNAVTFVNNHILNQKNPATRLNSVWYGFNADRNTEALKLAGEYATKSPAYA